MKRYKEGHLKLPAKNQPIDWWIFENIFRWSGDVRVQFDWDSCKGFPVHLEVRESIPSDWYTVWYAVDNDGVQEPASWDDTGAYPLNIEQASQENPPMPEERIGRIRGILASIYANTTPQSVLVAWRTGNDRTVILDGNHRAVANYKSGMRGRCFVFVIQAEANGNLTPDLMHHLP